jgi:uncharacterized protein (TIGR01619 family)
MAEDWKSYFSNYNDKLGFIAVDIGFGGELPVHGKPWLLWVCVHFRTSQPNGLPESNEFEIMDAIDDELAKHLGTACDAVEVGRVTSDGSREFFFYGASDKGLKSAVAEAMRGFKAYKFEIASEEDADWSRYLDVLYPSEEDFQKITNLDILDALQEHGDTLTAVRQVDHWIYFRTEEDRKRFASEVRKLGYKIEQQPEEADNEYPLGLQISRDQSVTVDEIDDAVIELFRVAKQRNGKYDGWETFFVEPKN